MKKTTRILLIAVIVIISLSNLLVLSSCRERLKEDTVFIIDRKNSKIMNAPLSLVLLETSNVTLRRNGEASMSLNLSSIFTGAINLALEQGADPGLDMRIVFDAFVPDTFPGFDLDDLSYSFGLLQKSLNLSLIGLDFDDPTLSAALKEIAETGAIPTTLRLPNGMSLNYTAPYYIKTLKSEDSGKEFTGVFMGKHEKNGEPFMMLTLRKQAGSDKRQIYYRNDLVDLILIANEV